MYSLRKKIGFHFLDLSFLETEIIETRNGTADFCLLPNLAQSYYGERYFYAKTPRKTQNIGLSLKTKNFLVPTWKQETLKCSFF